MLNYTLSIDPREAFGERVYPTAFNYFSEIVKSEADYLFLPLWP